MKRMQIVVDRNGMRSQSYRWDQKGSHVTVRGLVFGESWQSQESEDGAPLPKVNSAKDSAHRPTST